KLQKRIGTLTEEYNVRTAKLKQAAKLVNEAFEIRKKDEVEIDIGRFSQMQLSDSEHPRSLSGIFVYKNKS
ncbi:MAG: hypothetical protein H7246_10790, partial [Phycisphaerae bacterium]|nr:hypothetical protein [Saprospiraceae bacterium]